MKSYILFTIAAFLTAASAIAQPYTSVVWQKKTGPAGGEITEVEYDATSGKYFAIAGSQRRLYISSDNGDTWVEKTNGSDFTSFYDIEITNNTIYVVSYYDIWASTDAGATFTQITADQYSFGTAYKLKRLTTGRLVVWSSNGLFYSTNNGASWTQGYTPSSGYVMPTSMIVTSTNQIFLIKDYRPYRSVDLGTTFTLFNDASIPAAESLQTLAVNNAGTTIYAVTNANMYSSDGTNTWANIRTGASAIVESSISDNSGYPSFLEFSADGLGMYFVDNVNHKLYSKTVTGAATTWGLRQSPFPGSTIDVSSAAVKDYPGSLSTSSTVIFGAQSGIYKTTSGGSVFADSNVGIAGIDPYRMEADNSNNVYMVTQGSDGLLKSVDGGNNWSRMGGFTGYINDFTINTTGNTLYLTTGSASYRSTNAGSSWTTLTPPSALYEMISLDNDKVVGLSGSSLYYSANQGTSWSAFPAISGMPAGSGYSINSGTLCAASANLLFLKLYDYNTSTYKLYKIALTYSGSTLTAAAGSQITTAPIAYNNMYRMEANNGRLFLGNPYGSPDVLAVTSDGGANWSTYTLTVNDIFIADNGYVFTTDTGNKRVDISRDYGATFQQTTFSGSTAINNIRDIAVSGTGIAYVGFNGDYVHASAQTIVTPANPSSLTVVASTYNAVSLKWTDNSANENHFAISYSTNGVDFVSAGEINDGCTTPGALSFFTVSNLNASTNYTFRVWAVNDAGSSGYIETSTTTPAACAQTLPDNRSWSAVNTAGTFSAISPAQTVNIKSLGNGLYSVSEVSFGLLSGSPYYSSNTSATISVGCAVTTLVKSDGDDVRPEGAGSWNGTTTLTLKWRACRADANATITFTLNSVDPAPSIPASPGAYNLSNTSIEVNWTAGTYDKTYIVERSLNGTTGWVQIGTSTYPTTKFIDNGAVGGLTIGTQYYYRIKARNGNASPIESAYSSVVNVTFNKPKFTPSNTTLTNYVSTTVGSYWADFNNDGFQDYLTVVFDPVTNFGTVKIFANNGLGDFSMITPVLDNVGYFFATIGDYDNDGKIDMALHDDDSEIFDIYRGNGDFTFVKQTSGLGDLANLATDNIDVQSSSWADINNDGLLDLMAVGTLPNASTGVIFLYKQLPSHAFTKINGGELATDVVRATASFWADYDNDGDQDVIITNTSGAVRLYKNNADETFTKVTSSGITGTNAFTAAWGDYNNDGFMDLYLGSTSQNALYKNNGNNTFTQDLTTSISIGTAQSIGSAWGDFNNDGYLDLLSSGFGTTQTRLFIRDASSPSTVAFNKYVDEKITDLSISHYGAASADYDNNGYQDIGLSSFIFGVSDDLTSTNTTLFKNNIQIGNWVQVKLNPTTGNKEGIGAKIRLTAGGVNQSREVQSVSAMVCRNSPIAHFGIGSSTSITNIQVVWANGAVQNYPNAPINQVITIDQDNTGPSITTRSPVHNATGISTSTTIVITLNEASMAVAGKNIVISKAGTPVFTLAVTSAAKSGNQYTFTLPSALEANVTYAVAVEAGAFTDKYVNGNAAYAATSWTFTTTNLPAILTRVPAAGATNVAANTTLALTFDKPVVASSSKGIKIFASTDLVNPVFTLIASTSVISGNTATFTLPSKLSRTITYNVAIEAGAFNDGSGNDIIASPATDWSFTIDAGPVASSVSPANNASGIAVNTPLQITFDRNVAATTGKIKVMDGATVLFDLPVASNGTITNAVYSLTPSTPFPNNRLLKVTVEAGAFVDATTQTDFAGIATDGWNFTTVNTVDVTAPTITFDQSQIPSTLEKGFATFTAGITVTDDRQVASAVMKHRKVGEKDFQSLVLTFNATNSKWEGFIANTLANDMGFEYYFEAQDNAAPTPNTGKFPTAASTYLKATTSFKNNPPSVTLPTSGTATSWKIISIPYVFEGNGSSVSSLFSALGDADITKWRLVTYKPGPPQAWDDNIANLIRGKGYFINTKISGAALTFVGASAPPETRDNLFSIQLKAGWNQIGNPYTLAVNVSDVKQFNAGLANATFVTFSNGTYASATTIGAFEGGFVNVPADTEMKVPFPGQTTSGGRMGREDLSNDISADEWNVNLSLTQGDQTFNLGGFGMALDAAQGIDAYDMVTPPRFFDFVELSTNHPEHVTGKFSADIVPAQSNYTWNFNVASSTEGIAVITWNNSSWQNSAKDLFLLDESRQLLINMKEVNSYSFNPKESPNFSIHFGEQLRIAPESVSLGKAFPNPTSGFTSLAFSLPEAGGAQQLVTLELTDAMGRAAGTVVNGYFGPGYHEVGFDARNFSNGLYVYRLNVQSRTGKATIVNKLVIK